LGKIWQLKSKSLQIFLAPLLPRESKVTPLLIALKFYVNKSSRVLVRPMLIFKK
jgi:hypothetical protein